MSKEKKNLREVRKPVQSPFRDYWDKSNYILIASGLGVLTLGYIFMAQGNWDSFFSLTISPVTLLIAYIIIIPLAILLKSSVFIKKKTNVSSKD
ncbi:MAG: hypothetical protein D4R68_01510 [Ignavibacteriales bacterium]|nr:MAG: hypothetical protein D4R68_01510 [Ignavibacteriales bacterium]